MLLRLFVVQTSRRRASGRASSTFAPRVAALAAGVALVIATPGPGGALAPGSQISLVTTAAPGAVASDPAAPPLGRTSLDRWEVTDLGGGRFDVSWTSPTDLPMSSDRPTITGSGLDFGAPTIEDDGRTVRALVTTDDAPDPADLDVVLSGDRLDEAGFDPAARVGSSGGGVTSTPPRTSLLPTVDPALPGSFETVTSDYDLDPVKLPGMREPIEMIGHVVEPSAAAPSARPLVLFLHGRHEVCYDPTGDDGYAESWPCPAPFAEIPSHLGYDYLQQVLASQGYATVSVRVNGINAQDYRLPDGGADARAAIVRRHLDHWVDLAAEHQVDLDQVVLVGHSRGGEGANRASLQIPTTAPYRIAGQVLLAPTDFGAQSAPYVPTVTVLPYCDGDVYDIQGQQFTDTGRDLTTDDTSLKSSVLVMGANHNYFNTEWTPGAAVAPAFDDWYGDKAEPCGTKHPSRLGRVQQRAVGTAYVAGAVKVFTGNDDYLPLYDGSAVTVDSIGDADVRTHALGGGRDLRRPGDEATPTLATGGARTRLCRGVAAYSGGSFAICGANSKNLIAPHWVYEGSAVPNRQFFELEWTAAGAVGGLRFDDPLDLSAERLELRTIVDPRRGPVDLDVRLSDSTGATTTLAPSNATQDGHTLDALLVDRGLTKLWAQALVVDAAAADPADPANAADLSDIVSIELVGLSNRGRLWVADLAAAPTDLAAVPDVRLARVRLGDVRLPEGGTSKATRSRVARVPFEIDGALTRPGRIVVLTVGQSRGDKSRFAIDLAPGQTSGTIPIRYGANTLADYDQRTEIAAWALEGVITDDYLGRLIVVDDDPQPELSVKPVQRRVVEGQPIVLRAKLSTLATYDATVTATAVKGPGEDLRGDDVPRAWLREHGNPRKPGRPLFRLYVGLYDQVPAGERRIDIVIPTSRDSRVEGKEKLTLAFRFAGQRFKRTVTVVDAD